MEMPLSSVQLSLHIIMCNPHANKPVSSKYIENNEQARGAVLQGHPRFRHTRPGRWQCVVLARMRELEVGWHGPWMRGVDGDHAGRAKGLTAVCVAGCGTPKTGYSQIHVRRAPMSAA